VAGQLEPKPGVPPSPAHLDKILDVARDEHVRVILNENIYPDDAARFVSSKTPARVVNAPISVGGSRGAKDYFSLMDEIANLTAGGFSQ